MEQGNDNLRTRLLHSDAVEKSRLLFAYMKAYGQENYEEDVSQYEHALQTAILAKNNGGEDPMIAAALLHDIGHMLAEDPQEKNNPTLKNDKHEDLAAEYLTGIFPPVVIESIRLHVPAKRYLCTVDESYFEGLSNASKKSFYLQGGPMSEEEKVAFEANAYHHQALQLRKWDDEAKIVGKELPDIQAFTSHVENALSAP